MLLKTEPPRTENVPAPRKYDTPTLNELLLRIFGEEHRALIHTTLADLDAEYAAVTPVGAAEVELAPLPTATGPGRAADPFEAIGAELRREERFDDFGAFER